MAAAARSEYKENNIVDKQVVVRVAVIVTVQNVEKVLGMPKLPSGTGSAQADVFVNLVTDWSAASFMSGSNLPSKCPTRGPVGLKLPFLLLFVNDALFEPF